MADIPFVQLSPGPSGRASAVTPSDATVFTRPTRALWIGGAGNVAVRPAGQDTNVTFTAVAAGTLLQLSVLRVLSTGTTATNIVAMF